MQATWLRFGGIFDWDGKNQRLKEIEAQLANVFCYQNISLQTALQKEQCKLYAVIDQLNKLTTQQQDCAALLEMASSENDNTVLQELDTEIKDLKRTIETLIFQQRFIGPADSNNAYLDIQAGSGGTEAQDWAEMLLRMYLKFGDQHTFNVQLVERSEGDVAGIKSATIKFSGAYAYGWLRTETGVHRLVRKSPFDANHKRHTSFASVFVYPEVDDSIQIEINPADLAIDTYRAQGAGGQHVNKTESAIRITHRPTGIVVQCQSERSQHQNRLQAMKQLKAKLYERELRKQQQQHDALEASKSDISWGNQIRSYVLDDARVKDVRTGYESRNPQTVLDGNLDAFIQAALHLESLSVYKTQT